MQVLNWRGRARHGEQGGQAPARATASVLPPAQMAVRFGRSPGARRVQHWIVVVWLIAMTLAAGLGWLLWQLPEVLAIVLIVLVGLGAMSATVAVALVLATMRRASVAAGDGWVGYRVLGRWRVVRPSAEPSAARWFGAAGAPPPYTEDGRSSSGKGDGDRSPSGPIELGPGGAPGPER